MVSLPLDASPDRTLRALRGALLERAQRLCDRWLEESSAAADLARELEGRSLLVRIEGIGIEVALTAEGGRILLGSDSPAVPSAMLRGAPLDLLRLLPADPERSLAGRLKETHAELTGSVQVAERFAEVLRLARPDLEEELASWIGDIPAHEIGRLVLGALGWARSAAQAARENTSEYLREEARVLPTRLETSAFGAEVERLRDDVERAAQRLERLVRGLGAR